MNEVLDIYKKAEEPTQDYYLDSIFNMDTTSVYYRFFHHLVKKMKPELVVEIGIMKGYCTAHIAAASENTKVIAIDPFPNINTLFPILGKYNNITYKRNFSYDEELLSSIKDKSIDICFVDAEHEYEAVTKELNLWYPKIKSGGMMFFDDINLNDGMRRFWNEIQYDKVILPNLHWSGFGLVYCK